MAYFINEGKLTYSTILGRDWIHTTQCVPSTLHQKIMFWNGDQVETVEAKADPAMEVHFTEAVYFSLDVYLLSMMPKDAEMRKKCNLTMKGYPEWISNIVQIVKKTDPAFRSPGEIGIFKLIIMPVGLKNTKATYQRAINAFFYDLISACMEVYIDDVVVKSRAFDHHMLDLWKIFTQMRLHDLKMNLTKCAFGV
ncbi:uncharacterized protein LOC127247103 [Andrographis paniculata]|uniref:uncharacterized protein LOC127247103 n=1 Tax=Andrographis paniculata TaxID=175694 RepID=UPI0021E79044|nr:uncharacterized protein LOC127247103 [Andrographis paniculata]